MMDFCAKLAWPLVALIAILVLGPGGVLQKIIGELADKLFRITDAVNQFKATVNDFHKTQVDLQASTEWVVSLQDRIALISAEIKSINSTTQQLAISDGSRSIEKSVTTEALRGGDIPVGLELPELTVDEKFADLRSRWDKFCESLKAHVGEGYDGRAIGQAAWKLVDGRRKKQIAPAEAELIESLHSQMKRFNRMQGTREEWLTRDVYAAFIRGVEQAETILNT